MVATGAVWGRRPVDTLDQLRTADVETLPPPFIGVNSQTLTAGTVYGMLARVRRTQTYGTFLWQVNVNFAGATDLRGAVFGSDGSTKLAETANLGNPTAGLRADALAAPVALVEGQWVYLALGGVGQSAGQPRCTPTSQTLAARIASQSGVPITRSATGYAGGALPALGTAGAALFIWMGLAP